VVNNEEENHMSNTFYSYCRGGNGVGVGAEMAGFRDVGGVEFDPAIAAACDQNFVNAPTTIADVCAVDPAFLLDTAPTWFHASPSCKNASQAKVAEKDDDGNRVRETAADRAAGAAVARFIAHWTPRIVTIENVWQYRTFEAFERIRETLRDTGYSYEYWHLNAADYGVPQTRKRLILVARHGLYRIQRPHPTHRDGGDMFHAPWIGWYEAIEDLIPGLPRKSMPPRLQHAPLGVLVDQLNATNVTMRQSSQPAFTLSCYSSKHPSPRIRLTSGDYATDKHTLARLQSFPAGYILPDNATLAGEIIGNAAPPLLMRAVVLPLVGC